MTTCQKINVFPSEGCYEDHASECGENDLNLVPIEETVKSIVLNTFFPVGSVYTDVTGNVNPNTQFGGTWVKIQNAFLYGSGSKSVGNTGGAETVTLTTEQMPSHSHGVGSINASGGFITGKIAFDTGTDNSGSGVFNRTATNRIAGSGYEETGGHFDFYFSRNRSGSTSSAGSGGAHNNMPPYIVVNIWKRTA